MLKQKQSLLLLLFVVGLATIMAVLGNSVDAGSATGETDHIVQLPFISAPDAPPPSIELAPFATGLPTRTITAIVHAGDKRLFVTTREGRIFIVRPDGTWLPDPFLDIHEDISTKNWEEGLLGLVFHPQYPTVPFFFVSYTDHAHVITVERFTVKANDPGQADVDSRITLLDIEKQDNPSNPAYQVHNGGDLHFGPDGYLYAAFGDGGPDPWFNTGDPHNSGQRKDTLLGKMIRIDVNENGDNKPDCGQGYYTIPSDNPFADGPAGHCDEIWSTGFRNPWRFSFDSLTGDLYIGDVGESLREEIDFQPAGSKGGENYGWHCFEGSVDYGTIDPDVQATCPEGTVFKMPVYEYDQSAGDCSVIGGYVYRGQQYPALDGRYLFGDFCRGRMWILTRTGSDIWTRSPATATNFQLSTFGQDINGELYVGNFSKDDVGDIRRVVVP